MVRTAGTTGIVSAAYQVTAPTSPAVLSVEDHVILQVQLRLTR